VQIGIAGREHFEILTGLKLGDSVVAGPYDAIRSLEEGKPLRKMKSVVDSTAAAKAKAKGAK
jgi:HlyD family secretion protein